MRKVLTFQSYSTKTSCVVLYHFFCQTSCHMEVASIHLIFFPPTNQGVEKHTYEPCTKGE
jgi:hypothetical protein